MIIDVTGIELIPGNNGEDCPGNGEHKDENGNYNLKCCITDGRGGSLRPPVDVQKIREGAETLPYIKKLNWINRLIS